MTCREYDAMAIPFLLGQTTRAEREAIKRHYLACRACRDKTRAGAVACKREMPVTAAVVTSRARALADQDRAAADPEAGGGS
jgi:hypothetical protein